MKTADVQPTSNEPAFFYPVEAGYLRISGPDRSAFLQRQTTNDVNQLEDQRVVLTALVSPTARILDVLYLLADPGSDSPAIGLITLPGRADTTYQYFKSRIFFNDQVEIHNTTADVAQIDLFGPQSEQVLLRLDLPTPPAPGELILGSQLGLGVRLLGHSPHLGLGYRLLAPIDSFDELLASLAGAGAVAVSEEGYDILRVEAGLPAAGKELTEEYTPLETNLRAAISDSKGCYTGQEVVARQINYDKITRGLVGLRLKKMVDVGAEIQANDRPVGKVTSVVESPRFGPVALAVVKRPFNQAGETLVVGDVEAQVTGLPFTENQF